MKTHVNYRDATRLEPIKNEEAKNLEVKQIFTTEVPKERADKLPYCNPNWCECKNAKECLWE